jgi:hypothetical protein
MRLENFALDSDGISLNWQGHNLDLHNCFDFECVQYCLQHQQVTLLWIRSPEWWAKSTVLPGLRLIFKNVSFLRVKERDADYPLAEDGCLAGVSFHPVAMRDDFDSISVAFAPTDDITFFFQSEWGVKINAESAELIPLPGDGY